MSNIPKVIHYCWFGRNPLPKSAKKCIESWRKFLPDYEIKEWNEDNFDVNITPYTTDAYKAKKYAFVSDYARFWILYHYGGLYFDTDVEVIKPLDDIIARGPFMGIEVPSSGGSFPLVNPGLGLGVNPDLGLYKAILDYYVDLHFFGDDGVQNPGTVVTHNTNVLKQFGLKPINDIQEVARVLIYPRDYFNPLDDATGRLVITQNTRTIHWYAKTWVSGNNKFRLWLSRFSHRIFGVKITTTVRRKLQNVIKF